MKSSFIYLWGICLSRIHLSLCPSDLSLARSLISQSHLTSLFKFCNLLTHPPTHDSNTSGKHTKALTLPSSDERTLECLKIIIFLLMFSIRSTPESMSAGYERSRRASCSDTQGLVHFRTIYIEQIHQPAVLLWSHMIILKKEREKKDLRPDERGQVALSMACLANVYPSCGHDAMSN